MQNKIALELPDALLVRYYRADELNQITVVQPLKDGRISVSLHTPAGTRTDIWRDLGGGLGYIPDAD